MLHIRKLFLFLLTFTSIYSINAQKVAPLTVEKIMRDPKTWIGTSPSNIFWSSNGEKIFFSWNPEQHKSDSLYSYSLTSQKIEKVGREERLALPSQRGVYNSSKTLYVYEKEGDLYLLDLRTHQTKRLMKSIAREYNASFSSDGKKVHYQQEDNVYAYDLQTGFVETLTNFKTGEKKKTVTGTTQDEWLKKDQLALFDVLRERKEMHEATKKATEQDKQVGPKEIYIGTKRIIDQTVAPSGKFVTYTLMELPKNSKATIVPNYVTESGFTENLNTRPKVGAPAASYEFWVYDIVKDTTRKLSVKDLPGITDKPDYLKDYPVQDSAWKATPRKVKINAPIWSPDGKTAVAVIKSLDNKDRWIVQLDAAEATIKLIDRQRDEAWIGGPGVGGYFMSAGEIGWIDASTMYYQSEKTGYSHLYTYNIITQKTTVLTSGNFEVQQVKLSKDKQHFYISANKEHPGEQHLYKLAIQGGQLQKLTTGVGAHDVTISPNEEYFAIRYSNSNTPWELYLQPNSPGAVAKKLTSSTTSEFNSYAWRTPVVTTIPARDGQSIYARVYKPAKSNGKAVIFVHGAGYLQNAHKWWSNYFREYMFHNLLTDKGYTVLDIDYRGSAGYGRDWRTGIYRHMGGKDLDDHEDAAKWLVKHHKVHPQKIGVYGGSYGGFITLMAMFTKPDLFKAGAALRPVTDWAAYNHPYTANILNEPQQDSLAYRKSSPIYHAAGLKGHLLICHGMLDVNVHYQDVVRLSQRLIELGKDNWELASYPMEDHGFVEPSSWTDEYKRILKLFEEKL